MKNKTTLLLTLTAIGVLAVTTAFTTNARTSRASIARSVDPQVSYPADVIALRADFEAQCVVYEKMIKSYNGRLEELSEDRLTRSEADELLAEVDDITGEQEKLVRTLRKELSARITGLGSQRSAS